MLMKGTLQRVFCSIFPIMLFAVTPSYAEESAVEIATKLTNPIAYLTSIPFQYNYDHKLGSNHNGLQNYVEMQPVIPAHVGKNYHFITHMIATMIWEHNAPLPPKNNDGFGDFQIEGYLAPKKATQAGFFWGAGPYLYFPTSSLRVIGTEQYMAGFSAVVIAEHKGWTYGMVGHQAWRTAKRHPSASFADNTHTYLQPFINYVNSDAWTYSLNTESFYFWHATTDPKWSVPINFMISKLIKIDKWALSLQGGLRYWIVNPPLQAHGLGGRATITLVFPETGLNR